jgi:hypothetical protein
MRTIVHLLLHDLRRLWPLVLLHAAALAWRSLELWEAREPFRGLTRPWELALIELLTLLLIGFVVFRDAPLVRRAFWRRLPIHRVQLLAAKLVFVACFVFLPRLLAQGLFQKAMGFGEDLALWTLLDQAAGQGLWVMVVLALVSLCRRPIHLGFVVAAVGPFLVPLNGLLRSPMALLFDQDDRAWMAGNVLLSTLLLFAVLYFLVELYLHLRIRAAAVVGTGLLVLLAASVTLSGVPRFFGEESRAIAVPEGMTLDVEPAMMRELTYNDRRMLPLRLVPRNLPPYLGVKIRGVSGEFRTLDGQRLSVASPDLPFCQISEELRAALANPEALRECDTALEVPLFNKDPAGAWRDLEGTLKIQVEMVAFLEQQQRLPLRVGAKLNRGLESYRVHEIHDDEAQTELLLSRFVVQRDSGSIESPKERLRLYLWNPEERRLTRQSGRGFSASGGTGNYPLMYDRVAVQEVSLSFFAEGGLSQRIGEELLYLDTTPSEPFTVEVTVEGFRMADYY